ncbi:unnamed protein product [Rangifer tarandus platyrhynchus]|uniref:Uncharacterized protein n=2 Tax=Rangifer tarandus platyrhynchus TaxID=3082113 RepID=A0ABN8YL13_RANTA|nr:unnamed protein product [Rangifer tarandus platyrhynchus]
MGERSEEQGSPLGSGGGQLSGPPGTGGLVGGSLANGSLLLPPSASQAGPEPAVKQTPYGGDCKFGARSGREGRGLRQRCGYGNRDFHSPLQLGTLGECI